MCDHKKNEKKGSVPGVTFVLEDDAQELFEEYINHISSESIKEEKRSEVAAPRKPLRKHKNIYSAEIDLHGLTLEEAESTLERVILHAFNSRPKCLIKLKIITGKGLRSGLGGSVLPYGAHAFIRYKFQAYIKEIDPSPDEVRVNNMPIRGHFFVLLKAPP